MAGVAYDFRKAKAGHNGEYYDTVMRIFQHIFKNGQIKRDDFDGLVKNEEAAEYLLKANIFSYIPSTDDITFQSKTVEVYICENLPNFKMNETDKTDSTDK